MSKESSGLFSVAFFYITVIVFSHFPFFYRAKEQVQVFFSGEGELRLTLRHTVRFLIILPVPDLRPHWGGGLIGQWGGEGATGSK